MHNVGPCTRWCNSVRPLKGPIWVSSVDVLAPEPCEDAALRSKLWEVFEQKGNGTEKLDYPTASVTLHGEWVGFKKQVDLENPSFDARDQFNGLQGDRDNSTTIFYLSGSGWM